MAATKSRKTWKSLVLVKKDREKAIRVQPARLANIVLLLHMIISVSSELMRSIKFQSKFWYPRVHVSSENGGSNVWPKEFEEAQRSGRDCGSFAGMHIVAGNYQGNMSYNRTGNMSSHSSHGWLARPQSSYGASSDARAVPFIQYHYCIIDDGTRPSSCHDPGTR